jgi:hypothetical protein
MIPIRMRAIAFEHMGDPPAQLITGELRLICKPELEARLASLDSILTCAADDSLHLILPSCAAARSHVLVIGWIALWRQACLMNYFMAKLIFF